MHQYKMGDFKLMADQGGGISGEITARSNPAGQLFMGYH